MKMNAWPPPSLLNSWIWWIQTLGRHGLECRRQKKRTNTFIDIVSLYLLLDSLSIYQIQTNQIKLQWFCFFLRSQQIKDSRNQDISILCAIEMWINGRKRIQPTNQTNNLRWCFFTEVQIGAFHQLDSKLHICAHNISSSDRYDNIGINWPIKKS